MACDQVPSTRQGASGFPDVLCRRLHVLQQLRGLSSITCHNKHMPPEVGGWDLFSFTPTSPCWQPVAANEVCWSPPWPTSSSHCWSLRIRWISPPGRCSSASRSDLSSCTLDAWKLKGRRGCGLGSYIKIIWKLHFVHWNCHWKNMGFDTYWDFPPFFKAKLKFLLFRPFFGLLDWGLDWVIWPNLWKTTTRTRADGNGSDPWQLQIDSRLVYLPSVVGDWGEFLFPRFFCCVFHFPFSMYVLFKTVLSFVCFWSSRMQWRTKGPTATLKLTLGTRITCAHGWVSWNTASVDGESQGLGGYLWAGKRESQATLPGGGQGQIWDPRFESWRCEMISCIILLHFVLHVLKIRWDTI